MSSRSEPEPEPELQPAPTFGTEDWHADAAALGTREQFECHVDGRVGGLEGSGNLADDLAVQDTRFGMMSSWLQQSARAPPPPVGACTRKGSAPLEVEEENADWDLFGEDTEVSLSLSLSLSPVCCRKTCGAWRRWRRLLENAMLRL